jgi:nucleoside-diphosphate-sugar epimerase
VIVMPLSQDRDEMTSAPGPGFPVLVTGGFGAVGGLLRRAWAVRGVGPALWHSRRHDGAELRADLLTEGAAVARAMAGVATVLHLAGPSRSGGAVHRNLALAVLDAARGAGVRQVFLASSAAVYGVAEGGAAEDAPARPVSAYGAAKLAMEAAARDWCAKAGPDAPRVTSLRIGNVAGADLLLGGRGVSAPVLLDILPDGHGPLRSYIGPQALGAVLCALIARGGERGGLPDVLNLALPGGVYMEALLSAAGRDWTGQRAPEAVIGQLVLDTTRLSALVDLGAFPATAEAIVADLRSIAPASEGSR